MIVCKKENVIKDSGTVIREIIGRKPQLGGSQGMSASTVQMLAGCSGECHLHRGFEELYCVMAGEGYLTVGEQQVEYRRGDFILIERGEAHFVTARSDSSFIVVCSPAWSAEDCIPAK